MNQGHESWKSKVWTALALLLAVALGARVVAELLAPLIPGLIVLAILLVLFWLVIGGRKHRS